MGRILEKLNLYRHSPTAMVRLCFALFLLCKRKDRIDMPRRLMDDLEGEVIGEEIHEGGLWEDIQDYTLICLQKCDIIEHRKKQKENA